MTNELKLVKLVNAAIAALPQVCGTSSQSQRERMALEEAIIYAGFDPYNHTNIQQVTCPTVLPANHCKEVRFGTQEQRAALLNSLIR